MATPTAPSARFLAEGLISLGRGRGSRRVGAFVVIGGGDVEAFRVGENPRRRRKPGGLSPWQGDEPDGRNRASGGRGRSESSEGVGTKVIAP